VITFVDLVLDNGELVRVECPDKHDDELFDSLENAMKRGDWWLPECVSADCRATYLGLYISRVAMSRVVAML
jgi:hypothetical protein